MRRRATGAFGAGSVIAVTLAVSLVVLVRPRPLAAQGGNRERAAPAAPAAAPLVPPGPGVAYDADCRAEGVCAAGVWIATDTLTAYREFGSRAVVAFRVRRSQRLQGLRGRYVVQTPGLVVYDTARPPFSAGDTAYVLGYVGEGYSTLWYRGRLLEDAPDGRGVRTLHSAEATWWLEVRDAAGRRGWVPFASGRASARAPLTRADSRY